MKPRIYLDNNATTFLDPRVWKVMLNILETPLGNPSSIHSFGQEAKGLLTKSRRTIASYLQVKSSELIFTSGGTESLNMVMQGLMNSPHGHIITSAVEHACVYSKAKQLESDGATVSFLEPGLWGSVTPDAVRHALRPDTRLIALTAVNNETGVKTDIDAIAAIAKEARIPFVVDGVCLLGKELFTIPDGVSAMCFSGHKLHAPAGSGLAYVRSTAIMTPLLIGGEQESGRRGGTENLPAIVGLAEAINLLQQELPAASTHMQTLRDRLEQALIAQLPGVTINGQGPRIANTTNLSFAGIEGEVLLARLDMEGVAVSHGSACSSGALEPSRILLNMGIPREKAKTAVRFSLSRFTTDAEIDQAIEIICRLVSKMRVR